MANSAYIKLVDKSKQQTISLEELKDLFKYYKEITSKTGDQLSWGYGDAAFPYELKERDDSNGKWFYLKGTEQRYNHIILGIGKEEAENEDGEKVEYEYIQVTLPDGATHGDKGKANEFCKFLGKKLEGELQLFNNRIMYYYKR